MPINLPGVPFKLTPQDMGGFDIGEALKQGFNLNKKFQEARTMPRKLAEELLQSQLKTKHDETINKYLDRSEQARISNTESSTGLSNLQTRKALMELKAEEDFQNMISGKNPSNQSSSYQDQIKGTGKPGYMTKNGFEGSLTGVPAEDYYANTGEDRKAEQEAINRIDKGADIVPNSPMNMELNKGISPINSNKNERVLVPGNPDLDYINDLYEKHPEQRKRFEARGYKKEQTIKTDPKSGLTTITTKYPNGKVTVESQGVQSANGKNPLTTSTRSKLQIQKQAIPQLKQLIKQLKENPSPVEPQLPYGVGNLYRPSARANYHSLINTGKDLFVKAKGLNVTDKSLETGETVLARGTLESDAEYHKRLDELDKLLDSDNEDINKALNEGVSTTSKAKKNNDPLGIR